MTDKIETILTILSLKIDRLNAKVFDGSNLDIKPQMLDLMKKLVPDTQESDRKDPTKPKDSK